MHKGGYRSSKIPREAHAPSLVLDYSKSYERVGHKLAGDRAVETGLQPRVANMAFGMYKARDISSPMEQ